MRVLLALPIVLLAAATARSADVKADHGNIVLTDKGKARILTRTGHDSDPALSPDGNTVVFTRDLSAPAIKDCAASPGDVDAVELWRIGADGMGAGKLLSLRKAADMHQAICAFDNAQFSSSGKLLYFETPAWATSGAVHVLDMQAGKEHFVTDGDGLTVLAHCADAKYRDALMVTKHKYFEFGGSYDWLWIVSPAGKEIGPVGESDAMEKDACNAL